MLARSSLAISASLLILACATAHADSLSDRRAAKSKTEAVEVEVGCGKLDKENCAIVIPAINEKTVSQNIRLKPLESKGSVESMDAICDGDIVMAVVQADVFARRSSQADCTGKVSVLGSPYTLSRLCHRQGGQGGFVRPTHHGLAAGSAAAGRGGRLWLGGELTLRNILAKNPEWKQRVDIQPDNAATGLNKLRTIKSMFSTSWMVRNRRCFKMCATRSIRKRKSGSLDFSTCAQTRRSWL